MKKLKSPQQTAKTFHDISSEYTENAFEEVVELIQNARKGAFTAANKALIDLYWQVGEYISRKLQTAEWGEGVVNQLAGHIATYHPEIRGFTRPNLFRMRQFYETYRHDEKVSPLVRQLPWTHNIMIMSRCKEPEERLFYLHMCLRERWTKREAKGVYNAS